MKLKPWERRGIIAVLLLAWALRWVALLDVPPGWRDDDLIELYTFSQEILRGGPVWYFSGASGHEPLYHTLRALLLAVAGLNPASARWMAAVAGTLAVLLTWAVGRRTFTREVGLLSAALVAVSFWSLMYSRVAIRHIGALPWMLLAIYWGWRMLQDAIPPRYAGWGLAFGTAGAMLTYYAGRLIPALLAVAVIFVGGKKGRWRKYVVALTVGVILTAPMLWAAAHVPGGDARVGEIAVPLNELRKGNLRPLLQTTWTTLGMFHAKGDPEWLYNVSERAVFGLIGAALFYVGVLTRVAHLNQANARLVLLWLGVGLAPAFISLPPSSYGHTILALPVVYILMAMPMKAAARRWAWTLWPLVGLTLGPVAARDVPDYFSTWPAQSMVRFLYRADYRALTHFLNGQPDVQDAAIGSMLFGPWDKVAVQTDGLPPSTRLRWVNPARALLGTDAPLPFYFQDENRLHPNIQAMLDAAPAITAPPGMRGVLVTLPTPPNEALTQTVAGRALTDLAFGGALRLRAVAASPSPAPGAESQLALWWDVVGPLPLPPETLIANPPPPGVYNEPRLKVFVTLMAEGDIFIAGDDGLWVDPYSLHIGDQFVQWHHLTVPAEAQDGPYRLHIGLYDPLTGQRWPIQTGADMIKIALDK